MLIEFRVKNFRSFRDEQIFTMIASPDKSLPDNVAIAPSIDHTRVVKSAVILGANASGKSNLIAAIVAPFLGSRNQNETTPLGFDPFLLDKNSDQQPSEFSYEFVADGVRYLYRIAVGPTEILLEELTAYPKKVPRLLYRRLTKSSTTTIAQGVEEKYNREFGSKLRLINSITPTNGLLLNSIAQAKFEPFYTVWLWLQSQIRKISGRTYERLSENTLGNQFTYDPLLRAFATQLARVADIGIADIISEPLDSAGLKISQLFGETVPQYKLRFIQQSDLSGELKTQFNFAKQSFGTQQLLRLSIRLYMALEDGQVLVVDELDSSLHPRLVRYIVELFHNPAVNRHKAQLIFNTHDATLLDAALFRRDQIWFTEKDEDGASTLFPLTSFSPRKGEAWVRGYMLGRYGAVPILGEPESLVPTLEVSSSNGRTHKSNGANEYEEGDDGEA